MATSKESAGERSAEKESVAPSIVSFTKQYDDYQAALRKISEKGVAARRDAGSAYKRKVADAVAEAYGPAREAYLKYITAYYGREGRGPDAPDPEVVRAEFEYREVDRRACEVANRACEDEWQAYCDRIVKIGEHDASQWRAAFVDYFDEVRRSIAQLDPIDPRDVQVLAHTLSLACVSALSGSSA